MKAEVGNNVRIVLFENVLIVDIYLVSIIMYANDERNVSDRI